MKINKYVALIALFGIPFWATAQIEYQIGIGVPNAPKVTTINTEFNNSASVLFRHVVTYGPRITFLGTYPIKEKLLLRTGLEGQPTQFYGEIFIFQDDPDKRQSLFKDYDYVNLFIPLEAQYRLTNWLYLYGGLGVNLLFDMTNDARFEQNSLRLGLTEGERGDFYEVIDDQVRVLNLSYRAGAIVRYKRIGLEIGYDHLINSVLKPFEYDGIERKETLKYGELYFKFLFFFNLPRKTKTLGEVKS